MNPALKNILLALLSSLLCYFLIVGGVELIFYHNPEVGISKDFNRTWALYREYVLPWSVGLFNLTGWMVNRRAARIAMMAMAYLVGVLLLWVPYCFSIFPHRGPLVIALITGVFLLNALIMRSHKWGTKSR